MEEPISSRRGKINSGVPTVKHVEQLFVITARVFGLAPIVKQPGSSNTKRTRREAEWKPSPCVASRGGHELQRPLGGADAIDSPWLKLSVSLPPVVASFPRCSCFVVQLGEQWIHATRHCPHKSSHGTAAAVTATFIITRHETRAVCTHLTEKNNSTTSCLAFFVTSTNQKAVFNLLEQRSVMTG